MDSPTTSGIGFSYKVDGRSVSPSQFARSLARAARKEIALPQPDWSTKDKTYQQAITDDPSVSGAVNAMTGLAAMIGGYYKALVDRGIPAEYAMRLTDEMKRPIMAKVLQGMGYSEDQACQEVERMP